MKANRVKWFFLAVRHTLRKKSRFFKKHIPYCKRKRLTEDQASEKIAEALRSDKPFMAGRIGYFEMAAMRMFEFRIKKKYQMTMDYIYNSAGFFPNDIRLGKRFTDCMIDAMRHTDVYACNNEFLENWFIDQYLPKESDAVTTFRIFEQYSLKKPWTSALAGKKVLVVTPFTDSVEQQYAKREKIWPGTDILPEFTLLTYRSLMTIGDMKDDRFADWFEGLEFMKKEILAMDFDVALIACGAYGYALASEVKKAGKQAVCMGGVLQILFGILGRRWDGWRFGGIEKMEPKLKPYYNENWTYPIEDRPGEADKLEYAQYWK